MKKLLSILAAIGISATGAVSVVSCSTSSSSKSTPDDQSGTIKDLTNRLAQAQKTQTLLSKQLQEEQDKMTQVQDALTAAQQNMNIANNAIASLQQQLADAQKQGADHDNANAQKIAELEKELADKQQQLDAANAKIKDLQGQLDAANAKITDLTGQLKTANDKIADLNAQIEKLQNQIDNPITMGEVSQSEGSKDLSKFDIKLAEVPEQQGEIDKSAFTLNLSGTNVLTPNITKAVVEGNVLHITLDKGLQQNYDYQNTAGYFIQFGLNTNVDKIVRGFSESYNIAPIRSASFMQNNDVSFANDRKSFTINLSNGNAEQGEVKNADKLFNLGMIGTYSNMPKVVSANVSGSILTVNLDKSFPTSKDATNLYAWNLTLNDNVNGIQAGMTKAFILNDANNNPSDNGNSSDNEGQNQKGPVHYTIEGKDYVVNERSVSAPMLTIVNKASKMSGSTLSQSVDGDTVRMDLSNTASNSRFTINFNAKNPNIIESANGDNADSKDTTDFGTYMQTLTKLAPVSQANDAFLQSKSNLDDFPSPSKDETWTLSDGEQFIFPSPNSPSAKVMKFVKDLTNTTVLSPNNDSVSFEVEHRSAESFGGVLITTTFNIFANFDKSHYLLANLVTIGLSDAMMVPLGIKINTPEQTFKGPHIPIEVTNLYNNFIKLWSSAYSVWEVKTTKSGLINGGFGALNGLDISSLPIREIVSPNGKTYSSLDDAIKDGFIPSMYDKNGVLNNNMIISGADGLIGTGGIDMTTFSKFSQAIPDIIYKNPNSSDLTSSQKEIVKAYTEWMSENLLSISSDDQPFWNGSTVNYKNTVVSWSDKNSNELSLTPMLESAARNLNKGKSANLTLDSIQIKEAFGGSFAYLTSRIKTPNKLTINVSKNENDKLIVNSIDEKNVWDNLVNPTMNDNFDMGLTPKNPNEAIHSLTVDSIHFEVKNDGQLYVVQKNDYDSQKDNGSSFWFQFNCNITSPDVDIYTPDTLINSARNELKNMGNESVDKMAFDTVDIKRYL